MSTQRQPVTRLFALSLNRGDGHERPCALWVLGAVALAVDLVFLMLRIRQT